MTPPDPGPYRPVTRREALLAGVVPLLAAVAGCDAQDTDRTTVEAPAPPSAPRRARSAPAWWPSATSAGDRPSRRWPGPWSAGRPRAGSTRW